MGLLRSETLKLATIPSHWITALSTPAVSAAMLIVATHTATHTATPPSTPTALAAVTPFVLAGPAALGALLAASEFRNGQHDTTMLCTPARSRQLAVHTATVTAALTLEALLTLIAATAVSPLAWHGAGQRLTLLVTTGMFAACLAGATHSSLAGTAATLTLAWLSPTLASANPTLGSALPAQLLTDLAAGRWPTHGVGVGLGWLATAAALFLLRSLQWKNPRLTRSARPLHLRAGG